MARKSTGTMTVETLTHDTDKRKNIPTAEMQAVISDADKTPIQVAYERRNRDLDPQLVWRGKDEQDWSDLVVQAPPLYIQDKVHPKVLIDDLLRQTQEQESAGQPLQFDLFADFNGIPDEADRTEFYKHDQNWTNRMILGDSLTVMASLAEREGLRGKVQCIYFDPPYGIKFNSNFQWSTTSRDVKDGNVAHITREPEQVKAFRDTWRDGINTYLTYLRDRLTIARDLLTESGSIFVQIGDENVHRVRAVMDEVFGSDNFIVQITVQKTGAQPSELLAGVSDYIIWFAKNISNVKSRMLYKSKEQGIGHGSGGRYTLQDAEGRWYRHTILTSSRPPGSFPVPFEGRQYIPQGRYWTTGQTGMDKIIKAGRVESTGKMINYKRCLDDFPAYPLTSIWTEVAGSPDKLYVVQTSPPVIQRCILMTTDPGDLVLDPTCGSGTTAYVAEQWGRRWITIDTSRVALTLARARLMGVRYPYYLLADSPEGQRKEAEVTHTLPSTQPTHSSIRQGFVYDRVPHITLKSIANNAEIDTLYESWQPKVQDALDRLNAALRGHKTPFRVTTGGRAGQTVRFDAQDDARVTLPSGESVPTHALVEWEVPRDALEDWPATAHKPLADFWDARIARQKAIDDSITAKAEFEYLYDRPFEDRKKVRVAGPFTVESLSPHRVLGVDENDELIDGVKETGADYTTGRAFDQIILENLKTAGVQQAHKEDRITFTSLEGFPGTLICAEGTYQEGDAERRAAIFIGPEFGTVTRPDLVEAAREAADCGFHVLIACAFNFEAHTTEFNRLGRVPVLKARMNADLHMADDLKNTGKGNLFVIFGEPDITRLDEPDGKVRVQVNGVDIFKPQLGKVESSSPDEIACWFIDTDYDNESFFVRHAYFLGANDPYNALKTTLKAEINADAWATLHSTVSRPFDKPKSGRIAVKVINHLGDEVMKVFRIP